MSKQNEIENAKDIDKRMIMNSIRISLDFEMKIDINGFYETITIQCYEATKVPNITNILKWLPHNAMKPQHYYCRTHRNAFVETKQTLKGLFEAIKHHCG
jgi:hypothetical protein